MREEEFRSGQSPGTDPEVILVEGSVSLRIKSQEPLIHPELGLAPQVLVHASKHDDELVARIHCLADERDVV